MARPPRIQYPGAFYHITTRGNRRARIFLDDRDFLIWQDRLAATVRRFNFTVYAFCQMPNHYHMLIETVEGNLSEGMQYFNSTYAQKFNWHHGLVGHVYQGRFHAVMVNREAQLLEVARYTTLNPVRAKLVKQADDWRWGSHPHMCGIAPALDWLGDAWLLSQFTMADRDHAIKKYRAFVNEEGVLRDPLADYNERGFAMTAKRRLSALPLEEYQRRYSNRNEAMARAHFTTVYTMRAIAGHFEVSVKTVSRAAAAFADLLKAELVSMSGCDPKVDTSSALGTGSSVGINTRKHV
ncbi:MAG TPA: transposase [Pseudoduganella sp.]|jgi:REP element-mobilizing transposase RayT